MMYAAQRYGVQATGITITPEQAHWANERIRALGLEKVCQVRLGDYREMADKQAYDKLACVGFLEHVGEALYPAFFRQAWDLLRPGGVFLNHSIVLRATKPIPVGWTFIYRYVFPETELAPVSTSLQAAENVGWEVRDVESLREHYALTLRHWLRRLEAMMPKRIDMWTTSPIAFSACIWLVRPSGSPSVNRAFINRCWSSHWTVRADNH